MSAAQTTKKVEVRPSIPRRLRPIVDQGGPGSAYRGEFARVALGAMLLGGTIANLAELFNVNLQTVHDWRAAHPAFRKAIEEGSKFADANVARSFYRRAIGYDTTVTTTERRTVYDDAGNVTGTMQIVTIEEKHIPADVSAAWRWLGIRCGWRLREELSFEEVRAIMQAAVAEKKRRAITARTALAEVQGNGFIRCPTRGALSVAGIDPADQEAVPTP
jgi:hypothetical protein